VDEKLEPMTTILGIESSCDETAAAVVRDRSQVLSSVIATQIDIHAKYGGVVPELASRQHVEAIGPVIHEALESAGIGFGDVDAVAVTSGPGHYTLAKTRDDAAGEAFDKVAKLLGLGYPGGPVIDRLAVGADETAVPFTIAWMKDRSLDFSFSGLKTAVRRFAKNREMDHHKATGGTVSEEVRNLVASFQKAAVDALISRTVKAMKREQVGTVLLAGGVACNTRLRRGFEETGKKHGYKVFMPSPQYTTDNAAMIAAAGFLHFENGRFATPDLNADPNWKL
jgi:N6-L-threonylcarbamoyladenine synthase